MDVSITSYNTYYVNLVELRIFMQWTAYVSVAKNGWRPVENSAEVYWEYNPILRCGGIVAGTTVFM